MAKSDERYNVTVKDLIFDEKKYFDTTITLRFGYIDHSDIHQKKFVGMYAQNSLVVPFEFSRETENFDVLKSFIAYVSGKESRGVRKVFPGTISSKDSLSKSKLRTNSKVIFNENANSNSTFCEGTIGKIDSFYSSSIVVNCSHIAGLPTYKTQTTVKISKLNLLEDYQKDFVKIETEGYKEQIDGVQLKGIYKQAGSGSGVLQLQKIMYNGYTLEVLK